MKFGVGIDVSKGKSTVAILSLDGVCLAKPFTVYHTVDGFKFLEEKLKEFNKEDIKFVMEETGNYHLPIFTYLLDKGYFVVAENAFKIKKYLDRGIRKAKTDNKDSLKLAEYTCDNWFKLNCKFQENDTYSNLRFLARQYNSFVSVQAQLKTNFSNFCDLSFPGFYQLLDDNTFILGLIVFKTYFHPDLVLQKNQSLFIDEIDSIAKELGHRSAGITLAKKIYSLASKTFSPRPFDPYSKLIASEYADSLIRAIKSSDNIISELTKLSKTLPEFDTVSNFPGCGPKLTPLVIAEIGDIRRFKDSSALVAYAGVDSPPYQSGSFEAYNRHISKRGNKYLRSYSFLIMKALKKKNAKQNDLRNFIFKKLDEGKINKVALVAGINKFLRIYYGTIRKLYIDLKIWNNSN